MKYIHHPGDPQGRPPYLGRNVLMHGALIRGDKAKLDAFCDLVLNQVDPDLEFEVVGNVVLYAALYGQRMSSAHPEDAQYGYAVEDDIGLWILTLGGRKGQPRALRWLPAFIFVDSASALMTGRELYGYPKMLGRMTRRGLDDADFAVSLRAECFLRKDPQEQAREHEVLRIERAPAPTGAQALVGGLFDLAVWNDLAANLKPAFLGMPMVFLKQMRDPTAVDEATVREVVAVTVAPSAIPDLHLVADYRLVLPANATFMIREALGCAAESPIESGFWTRFDFEVGVAERL